MKKPKEDPADKAARLRERRISELEQAQTTQDTSKALTTDLQSVYGFQSLIGMAKGTPTPRPAPPRASIFNVVRGK